MNKTYKFRLKPTKQQEQKFIQFAGQCRFMYNELLSRSLKAHKAKEKFSLTAFGLNYKVTDLKNEFEFLNECHINNLQESAKALSKAYQSFFKNCKRKIKGKKGFPRFKAANSCPRSFGYKTETTIKDNKIRIGKIGWVKFKQSQPITGTIKNYRVKQTATGKWNVTICVELDAKQQFNMRLQHNDKAVGVDVGLTTFLTLCNGTKIDPLKPFARLQKKLKKSQKRLSKCRKGSKNRKRCKKIVARLHEKIANQRLDFQHKLSSKLVNENQIIGVEDLSVGHGFEDGHATSKCGRMTSEMGEPIQRRHCYLCAECRDLDACRICDGNKTLYNMPDDCDVVCWLCKGSGLRVDEFR